MKATVVENVPATPKNMDRYYAELMLTAMRAVKDKKPMMLLVWENSESFSQQAVAVTDLHCAQVAIGFMKQFPYVMQTACRYIINYTVTLNQAMKEKKDATEN